MIHLEQKISNFPEYQNVLLYMCGSLSLIMGQNIIEIWEFSSDRQCKNLVLVMLVETFMFSFFWLFIVKLSTFPHPEKGPAGVELFTMFSTISNTNR